MGTKQSAVTVTDDAGAQSGAAAEPENTLGHYLVVRHAFGTFRKGDAIRDAAVIASVLAGPNARSVHKVLV